MWHNTFAILALFVHYIIAVPTWPNSIDEIEDLMVLQTGYRSLGFASAVTPCSNSITNGFRIAAGFVRTAFHDVAAFDAAAGTGGLDASIGFECSAPFAEHNSGPAFAGAMAYYSSFFNSKASMADLIALGTYASVRSCGGPIIPMKAGRIDATGPGANSLPDVQDSKEVLVGRFAKMGFSPQEMIQLVACGHSLGGVHPGVNGKFNPQDPNAAAEAAKHGVQSFDSTDDVFDNKVATEYVSGTSKSLLVVGPAALNSDLRVFSADGNRTIRSMTDPDVFQGTCQTMFQKMLERVPSNVRLSDVIQPYDVKPGQLNFNVLDDGSLIFSGEIRVRTTDVGVSNVQLVYTDKSGASCDGCSIDTRLAGTADGFDDSFSFYGFSAKVDTISSFKVAVTTSSGEVRVFDNNGNGFKVNDGAFVQVSSSSLSGSELKVVVAVRDQSAQPQITLSTTTAFEFNRLPTVSKRSGSVSKICGGSQWSYYSATFTVSEADIISAKLDVSVGGVIVDGFRNINFPSSGTTPSCISSVSTTLSTSTRSSTTSSSSSTISSSTSLTSSSTTTSSTTTQSSTTQSFSFTNGTSTTSLTTLVSDTNATTTSSTLSSSTSSSLTTTTSESLAIESTSSFTTSSSTSTSGTKIDKPSSSSKTSSTSTSVSIPDWYNWEPSPSTSSSVSSGPGKSTTRVSTGKGSSTTNKGGYATPNVPNPKHDDAQAALSSVYESLANKPAPSGGTDGGNQNVEGLDLNIQIPDVKPTITGTTAVYTNTVVYVTTFANAQESANVNTGAGAAQTSGSGSKPTAGAGTPGVSESWESWSASASSGLSATATKSGPIAKFTGAADSLRSGGMVAGMVAAFGVAVIML